LKIIRIIKHHKKQFTERNVQTNEKNVQKEKKKKRNLNLYLNTILPLMFWNWSCWVCVCVIRACDALYLTWLRLIQTTRAIVTRDSVLIGHGTSWTLSARYRRSAGVLTIRTTI